LTPEQTAAQTETANLQAQAARENAAAAADQAKATGTAAEATAYGTAAGIATSSAGQEAQATAIERYQQSRLVDKTVGAQRAAVAASGFREAGSSLSLLRDSVQQGHITDALTAIQGNINANGFLSQAAAATASQQAASAASAADLILAQQEAAAGTLALANSATLTAALKPGNGWGAAFGGGVNVRVAGGATGGLGSGTYLGTQPASSAPEINYSGISDAAPGLAPADSAAGTL
jgi:hypothetical protein